MRRTLTVALVFQGGIVVLGVALALLFGLRPWQRIEPVGADLLIAFAGTLPLLLILAMMPAAARRWRWAGELVRLVQQMLDAVFQRAWPGSVVLVSLLAGVGEELLFRGVVQDGLAGLAHPVIAIAVAAALFGLVHAVSLAYLIVATVIGLYLGLIYHWNGNLLVPIVIHALYDWIAIRFYLSQR
ncbi:MAG: CPBP family intramembrane metalloprotease [Pseudomonadota bacterium]|nr:MAG: CPBP family intramembrane metalloprotease [Pseudomonadota bacterium]